MRESSSPRHKENYLKMPKELKCNKNSISIQECKINISSKKLTRENFCSSKKRLWMSKLRRCLTTSCPSKVKMPLTVLHKRPTHKLLDHQELTLQMPVVRNRHRMIRCTWPTSSCWRHCPYLLRAWPRRVSKTSKSITIRSPFNCTQIRTATHRPKKPFRRSSRLWPMLLRSETARERRTHQWTQAPHMPQATSNSSQTITTLATMHSTDSEQWNAPNPKLLSYFALLDEAHFN